MRFAIKLTKVDRTPHMIKRADGTEYLCNWELIPDGTLSGDIVLKIDEAKITRLLAGRALRSKAKRATLAGGAIVAQAINLKREDA